MLRLKIVNKSPLTISSKPFLLFLLFVIGFLLFKLISIGIGPRISDENLYLYSAYQLTRGYLPYRDFPIANLPLQVVFYGFLIKLVGFHLIFFKILQLVFTIASALLIYRLISTRRGSLVGAFSTAFFLFSFAILATIDYATGVHEATFFLVLSWYLLYRSPKWAGFSFFLGLTFRRYILPAGLGLLIYQVLNRKFKVSLRFAIFSFFPYVVLNIILYVLFGEKFLTQAWRYQLLKVSATNEFVVYTDFMRNSVFQNLFAAAAVFVFLREVYFRIRHRSRKSKIPRVYLDVGLSATSALLFQYVFFRYFSNVYLLYLATVMPFLSVLAALALVVLVPARSRRVSILLLISLSFLNAFLFRKNMVGISVIENFDQIVKDVKEVTNKEDKLFGTYVVTPIIALGAGREVKDHMADLNYQRFMTGLISIDEATRLATESAVFFQFAQQDQYGRTVSSNPSEVYGEVIRENCELYNRYPMFWIGYNELLFWRCKR